MIPRPPADGTLHGASAHGSKVDLQRSGSLVRAVSPKTVVTYIQIVSIIVHTQNPTDPSRSWGSGCRQKLTSSDSKTGVEVVDDGEDEGLEVERHPVGGDEAEKRHEHDEGGVEPVDMLVPVGPGHGGVGDVNLLGVDLLAGAQRLVLRGAIRESRGLVGRGH